MPAIFVVVPAILCVITAIFTRLFFLSEAWHMKRDLSNTKPYNHSFILSRLSCLRLTMPVIICLTASCCFQIRWIPAGKYPVLHP